MGLPELRSRVYQPPPLCCSARFPYQIFVGVALKKRRTHKREATGRSCRGYGPRYGRIDCVHKREPGEKLRCNDPVSPFFDEPLQAKWKSPPVFKLFMSLLGLFHFFFFDIAKWNVSVNFSWFVSPLWYSNLYKHFKI